MKTTSATKVLRQGCAKAQTLFKMYFRQQIQTE